MLQPLGSAKPSYEMGPVKTARTINLGGEFRLKLFTAGKRER
jgi:hypothetical protein